MERLIIKIIEMKKTTKRKALILISSGLFVIATSQVFSHYIALPDFVLGVLMGVGIGLLLTATIFGTLKAVKY